jgi:hypothetical protein
VRSRSFKRVQDVQTVQAFQAAQVEKLRCGVTADTLKPFGTTGTIETTETKEERMPGFLLHLGATVMCSHAGQATPVAPYPRVLVSGQPTVAISSMYAVAGCTFPPPSGPCVTAQYVTSATRVFGSSGPLLLIDSQAICAPTGTPLIATVTQPRVSGI